MKEQKAYKQAQNTTYLLIVLTWKLLYYRGTTGITYWGDFFVIVLTVHSEIIQFTDRMNSVETLFQLITTHAEVSTHAEVLKPLFSQRRHKAKTLILRKIFAVN